MRRSYVFLRLEIEYDDPERPDLIGEEICRRLLKIYGVRSAEVSSVAPAEE